jgi:hypothetical protein
LAEFEAYAARPGSASSSDCGTHHGYFLPSEGASNIAYCLFSFPSLADYESYRHIALTDPESTALVESGAEEIHRQLRAQFPAPVAALSVITPGRRTSGALGDMARLSKLMLAPESIATKVCSRTPLRATYCLMPATANAPEGSVIERVSS